MGASLFWGGSSLAGNPCRRWLKLVAGSWRNASQAPGPALLRGSLDWRGRERKCETGTTAQIWRRTVCRILLADAISAPMPGKYSCLQAVRQFTFHCKFPQLQQLYPPRHAKDREGLCLPAAVFRVSSRLFADRRLSPFTNPWPPTPRPCSSGRSGLFGPPLCGGSAPATPPLLKPPAAASVWQYDLVDPLRPNFPPPRLVARTQRDPAQTTQRPAAPNAHPAYPP